MIPRLFQAPAVMVMPRSSLSAMAVETDSIILPPVTFKTFFRHDLSIDLVFCKIVSPVRKYPICSVAMFRTGFQFIFGCMAIKAERFMVTCHAELPLGYSILSVELQKCPRVVESLCRSQCPLKFFFMALRALYPSPFELDRVHLRNGRSILCLQVGTTNRQKKKERKKQMHYCRSSLEHMRQS